MGDWRYYARRAGSNIWLDTNVQIGDVSFTTKMSGPGNGNGKVPNGIGAAFADDGRLVWGKWDTLLLAEEDGKLQWVGICTAAYPDDDGMRLEFVGFLGWLQRVPFTGVYEVWQRNVFSVVRMLLAEAGTREYSLDIYSGTNMSGYTVGDPQPPQRKKAPTRLKGQTWTEYKASTAYKNWKAGDDNWIELYSDYKKYSLAWWEGPYIGEEIDRLAKETDFEYRERVSWSDRANLQFRLNMDLADDLVTRRTDIAFVDGMNLARRVSPKDGDEDYANQVIALGAGEGTGMVRTQVSAEDGRLFQAEYVNYKAVRNKNRLRALAQADLRRLNNKEYAIDQVVVWDVAGFSSLSTLRVGDEVNVQSSNTVPAIDSWRRVVQITRKPEEPYVTVSLEYAT